MRFNRNTLIFLVLAVVFIIVAALATRDQQPKVDVTPGDATAVLRPLFGGANVTDITSFTVRDEVAAMETVYAQQADGSWAIDTTTTGKLGPITQATIDNAVATVINLQSEQFASDKRADFGLEKPNAIIRFKTKAGDESVLQLGNRNPAGTRRYALVNDDAANVYLINASSDLDTIVTLATTPPIVLPPTPTPVPSLQLPGPLFGQFDPYGASRVEMVNNKTGEKLILARDAATNWVVEEATNSVPAAAIDNTVVTVMLSAYGFLQGTTAIPVTDLAPLGLDNPTYSITVTGSGTSATAAPITYHIDVGNADPSGALTYVRVAGFSDVATVLTRDLKLITDMIATPPYLPLATQEATGEAALATAEATTAP
jgi:hypothetical protein